MGTNKFSLDAALRFGWDVMKEHLWFFVGVIVIGVIINAIPNFLQEMVKEANPFLKIISILFSIIVGGVITMGQMKIALSFVDNREPELADLFSCIHLVFKYILATILYSLIVLAGFLLLIVPGIIWSLKYSQYIYLIVDREMDPLEALKESGRITFGAKWDLFVLALLVSIINLLGLLCCCIGLFATVPTTMVAMAYVYRALSREIDPMTPPGSYMPETF